MSRIIGLYDHIGEDGRLLSHAARSESNTIRMVNVAKRFPATALNTSEEKNAITALEIPNLTLALNRVSVFTGPSGAGKSTLLNLIGCMARPTTGRIFFNGNEITSLPERFLTRIRRTHFGFVFQSYHLIHGISAIDNVMVAAAPTRLGNAKIRARAQHLFERLRIADRANQMVQYLSGGEQQRVAIARALMNDPDVIIADEPTAHLNTALAKEFLAIITDLRAEGKTVVIASHDPLVSEAGCVDQVIKLRDGRVVETARLQENETATGTNPAGTTNRRSAKRPSDEMAYRQSEEGIV